MEGPTTKPDCGFEAEATKELNELVREVEDDQVRHGPRPRTLAQEADLLLARIDALEQDRLSLLDDLDELLYPADESEGPAAKGAPEPAEPQQGFADWTDELRMQRQSEEELAQLIREIEGPQPLGGGEQKPSEGRSGTMKIEGRT